MKPYENGRYAEYCSTNEEKEKDKQKQKRNHCMIT